VAKSITVPSLSKINMFHSHPSIPSPASISRYTHRAKY
jgi:hypothetical protein